MKRDKERYLLPRLSVTRPVTVLMIFLALLVVGYIAYSKIPLEMMPNDYQFPGMGVYVPYPNASPEEIEKQITRPIEQILGTVRNVRRTSSTIGRNYTWVSIVFNQTTDMDLAYAEVRDRMDRVKGDLPEDVERIYLRRFNINNDDEAMIFLKIDKQVPDLYYFLDYNLGKKLLRIDGVANVEYEGVEEKNFEVKLDMDKISAHRINLYEMVNVLRQANFAIPSGFVREGDKRFYIRSMGRFTSIDEIERLEIRPGILLSDIATVTFDIPKLSGINRINGKRGVWIGLAKEAGANSVAVHNAIMETLDREFEVNPNLQGVTRDFMFSQGQLILDAIADLQETAMWAAMFAVLILFFFLRHVRMTLVITLAIPISILATLVVMYFTGESINLVSLMGLMVCVGLVVDNSVVVVENIFRYRRAGETPERAAVVGAGEVARAIVMATLTTVIVFLPMILMSGGVMSYMMARLGMPVIFALIASLFVALVFIPLTTTRIKDKGKIGSSKLINWARDRYVGALRWAVAHRVEMVLLSVLLVFSVFFFTGDLGYEDEMQDSLDTNINLRLGKRYDDIQGAPLQMALRIEEWCEKHKDYLDYDCIISSAQSSRVHVALLREMRDDITPLAEKPLLWLKNLAFLNDMQRDPEAERRKFIRDNLMKDLNIIAGEAELHIRGSGSEDSRKRTIDLVLEGRDYDELRRWGERVRQEIKKLPDVLNVETEIEEGREELAVTIDRERARNANVDVAWAATTIGNALRGVFLPKFQDKDREIRILVRLREEDRESVAEFRNLRIPTLDGREVPLSSVATFTYTRGPSTITHWNKKPNFNLSITGNEDRIDQLVPVVERAMAGLGNGPGYRYSFGERSRRIREDQGDFLFAATLAITFIFLLMGFLFESFALPLTIVCCIPFAFAGSQLLLKIYGMPGNLLAYIGIVIIIGVVVNNGIVLVDLINRQRAKGMERLQAISLAGYYRFRPILMTAGTTIFSLLPMGFGDANLVGIPYNPLGLAMIGGLALNSVLTLMMVPVFYTIFDDMRKVWQWMIGTIFGRKQVEVAGAKAGADK